VKFIHLTVYALAAKDDSGLLRQLAITWIPTLAGAALLLIGLSRGGWIQTIMFAAALILDMGGVYLTSIRGNWRIHNPAHFTERHNLFIILAIGESVVAIGAGAAGHPLSAPLLVAAVLGVGAAVGLWWLYFDVVSLAAEHRFLESEGQARVKLAIDAYSYGHLPIVAGIVVAALGIEGVLANAAEQEPLGAFYATALFGGFALYLIGHSLFKLRIHGALSAPRLVALAAFLVSLPAASFLPPMIGLSGVVAILAALVTLEARRYSKIRRSLQAHSS